jgi:hypothetical protein
MIKGLAMSNLFYIFVLSKHKAMNKIKKYRILSPDRFPITMEDLTYTESELPQALKDFAKRYERQGYYSSMLHGRIELLDIIDYCSVIED